MMKTNRRNFLLSTAGLAGLGSLKAFAGREPVALNPAGPIVSLQDGTNEENRLQCQVGHEDYLYYQSKVDQFMRDIFPKLPKTDSAGDVAEFGSYRGHVTKHLIRLYGEKAVGFEIYKYSSVPQIHLIDFVKNPSCLKSDRLILGWNGFRRWSSHPVYRAKAFELIISRLAPGGLYIDDMAHELPAQRLKPFGLQPIYRGDFISCFQKV